jgi:hypothetical protein
LTIDFYLTSLAWNLNIYDLKKLAVNSIKYSSLSITEKQNALFKWNKAWDEFVLSTYGNVCEEKIISNESVEITDILPTYSYFNLTTNITFYGYLLINNSIHLFKSFFSN